MKLNLIPIFKAYDNMTIYRLFFMVVLGPTLLAMIALFFVEHEGTSHGVTHEVDMAISIGGIPKGTFTIGLFGNTVPKTVKNFEAFATKGHEGYKYEGTKFHRVVKKFMFQGGDVFKGKGHPEGHEGGGRISIYGETFDDENFLVKHAGPGFVSMTNSGPNSNNCQFFITTRATQFLDGRHVAFGKVVSNLGLLTLIEEQEVDENERPLADVVITNVQVRNVRKPYYISDDPHNIWDWIKTMSVPVFLCFMICSFFTYMMSFLDSAIKTDEDAENVQRKFLIRTPSEQVIEEPEITTVEGIEGELRQRTSTEVKPSPAREEETAKPAEVVEDDASKPKAT